MEYVVLSSARIQYKDGFELELKSGDIFNLEIKGHAYNILKECIDNGMITPLYEWRDKRINELLNGI